MAGGEDAARTLYPGHYAETGATTPAEAGQATQGVETPADPPKAAEAPGDGDGEASAADQLYGQPGEGVSASVASSALDQAFNPLEMAAREKGDHERAHDLAELRSSLSGLAAEFQIDQPAMRELGIAGAEYQEPATEEQLAASQAHAEEALRREHGQDFHKVVAGARRVVAEAMERQPRLRQWLENGAGNDPRVIAAAIKAARSRGYV